MFYSSFPAAYVKPLYYLCPHERFKTESHHAGDREEYLIDIPSRYSEESSSRASWRRVLINECVTHKKKPAIGSDLPMAGNLSDFEFQLNSGSFYFTLFIVVL